ncbi:penicillin-binding protein [Virgibacillus profundi]|uniref:serine-type D-Ala-D-Ala carboxypeptidase n=1 Tax=Virgibacillus profundi TaxID=2024555 RepID=A0A2A2IFH8_9BACI|nr:penicillin-binding protein [Virgibacillus profundi]PAV29910.1 penicillin-binding protein [Virgibacillus profundi]PXY54082.1 PASTA domain-containing protein [Virgibacillus profundi]
MRKNKTTHFMAGILIILFVGVFLVLAGRFMYIQATGEINNISLEEWADKKRTNTYSLSAERGKIFDKNGMTLAYDMPTFRVIAIVDEAYSGNSEEPKHVNDPEKTAKMLAPLLDVDASYILERLENGIENEKWQVEFGKEGRELSQQEKDEIDALDIPGIIFEKEPIRYYPNGMFASHIIGFARDTDIGTEDGISKEIMGIAGMEKEMNDLLAGKDGRISYQRDKYNKKLLDPNEVITKPEDGDDVYLTIDQKIQTLLEDVLTQVEKDYNPKRITAAVMNPKTGEILAMSNRPSYNPNNPANVENWYNDVISNPVEPGSTVKMFTWAAAIEEGVYNGSEGFKSGSYSPNEQVKKIHDHNGGRGWGTISFDEGFRRSSNVAAAKLAWEKLGSETYLKYLQAFDFDKPTGIDLPGEIPGQILFDWPIEKITTAFGQGSTLTPIQQMKAATAIANDGKMLQPYVIQKIVDPNTGDIIEEKSPNVVGKPISKETSEQVLNLLESVVNGENGTGKRYKLDDYTVGGKTGTAEIPGPDGTYMTGRENYIFSFLGMAPIDDPQLMMYVSVQQPELEPTEPASLPVSFIFNNVMKNSLHYLNIDPDKEENSSVETIKVPNIIGNDSEAAKKELTEKGLNVTVVGSGDVVSGNVEEGDEVLPNQRIILVADQPTMPNIIGWSKREVMQLSDLLKFKMEVFGNGYVITQNIKEGTPVKENDYLGVELLPPDEINEETNSNDESREDISGEAENEAE